MVTFQTIVVRAKKPNMINVGVSNERRHSTFHHQGAHGRKDSLFTDTPHSQIRHLVETVYQGH